MPYRRKARTGVNPSVVRDDRGTGDRPLPVVRQHGVRTDYFTRGSASHRGFPLCAAAEDHLRPARSGEMPRRRSAATLSNCAHSYDSSEMYGENYGYRSGLNQSMVAHLKSTVAKLLGKISLAAADLVLDIGCNDGTLLSFYPDTATRVGMDPTAGKVPRVLPAGHRSRHRLFSPPPHSGAASASAGRRSSPRSRCSTTWSRPSPSSSRSRASSRTTASGISSRATCRPCCAPTPTTRSATSTWSTTG